MGLGLGPYWLNLSPGPERFFRFYKQNGGGYEDDEKNTTQDTDNDEVVKRAIRRQPFCFESVGKLGLRISPDDEPTYLTIDEVREDMLCIAAFPSMRTERDAAVPLNLGHGEAVRRRNDAQVQAHDPKKDEERSELSSHLQC